MARKNKVKNRPPASAPVPVAQVFTDLEDGFFHSGDTYDGPNPVQAGVTSAPGQASSAHPGAAGPAPASAVPAGSADRRARAQDDSEVAYDSSMFDYSSGDEDEVEGEEEEAGEEPVEDQAALFGADDGGQAELEAEESGAGLSEGAAGSGAGAGEALEAPLTEEPMFAGFSSPTSALEVQDREAAMSELETVDGGVVTKPASERFAAESGDEESGTARAAAGEAGGLEAGELEAGELETPEEGAGVLDSPGAERHDAASLAESQTKLNEDWFGSGTATGDLAGLSQEGLEGYGGGFRDDLAPQGAPVDPFQGRWSGEAGGYDLSGAGFGDTSWSAGGGAIASEPVPGMESDPFLAPTELTTAAEDSVITIDSAEVDASEEELDTPSELGLEGEELEVAGDDGLATPVEEDSPEESFARDADQAQDLEAQAVAGDAPDSASDADADPDAGYGEVIEAEVAPEELGEVIEAEVAPEELGEEVAVEAVDLELEGAASAGSEEPLELESADGEGFEAVSESAAIVTMSDDEEAELGEESVSMLSDIREADLATAQLAEVHPAAGGHDDDEASLSEDELEARDARDGGTSMTGFIATGGELEALSEEEEESAAGVVALHEDADARFEASLSAAAPATSAPFIPPPPGPSPATASLSSVTLAGTAAPAAVPSLNGASRSGEARISSSYGESLGDLPGDLDDMADLADASQLEAGDPGDLPEPPAVEDDLALPVADLSGDLGWNMALETVAPAVLPSATSALPLIDDVGALASPASPGPGQDEAINTPLWTLPAFEPLELESESQPAGPYVSPSASTAQRFEPLPVEPKASSHDLNLEDQFQEAQLLLRDESDLVTPELKAAYWLEIGRLRLGKGQAEEARAAMRESLNAREAFVPALRALALLSRAENRWDELADDLETRALAADSDEQRAAALVSAAQAKLRAGRNDQAQSDLEDALASAPGELIVLRMLEPLYAAKERWDAVSRVIEAMVPRLPEAGQKLAYAWLGDLAANRLNEPTAARVWFRMALEIDPSHAPSSLALEALLRAGGELDILASLFRTEARRLSEPRHGAGGRGDAGHGDSGRGDSGHGEAGRGEAGHGDAGDRESGRVQAWLQVADLASARGEPIEAIEALQKALEIEPDNAFLRREFQGWLARTGDWQLYIDTLREELILAPDNTSRALLHLALAQLNELSLGNADAALESIEQAVSLRPDWQLARREQLRLLAAGDDAARLAAVLVNAAEGETSATRQAARYFQAAQVYEKRLSDPENAREYYLEAANLDSDQPLYGWVARRMLEAQGRWSELSRLVEQGRAPWPFSSRPGDEAGAIGDLELRGLLSELTLQDETAALDCFRQAVDAGSRSPIALGGLFRQLERLGERQAQYELVTRLSGEEDSGARLVLAWERTRLAEHLGLTEEATGARASLLELTPFLPALWDRSQALWTAGDLEGFTAAREQEATAAGEQADARLEALGEAMHWARRGRGDAFEALASDPANTVALDLHEWWLQETGDPSSLAKTFAVRLNRPIDIRQARYLQLRRAAWLEALGEEESALVEVAAAVGEGARDDITLNRLERLSVKLGQARSLQELLSRALEASEDSSLEISLRMARNLELRLDDPSGALNEYQRACLIDPGSYEALEGVIRVAGVLGETAVRADALAARARALPNAADQAAQWLQAGQVFLEIGDDMKADQALSAANDGGLLQEQALDLLAELYRQRGDVAALAAIYAPWIDRQNDEVVRDCWIMELADQLEALGAIDHATAHFDGLAREAYLPACLRLERLFLAEEDWARYAEALKSRALALKGEDARNRATERAMAIRSEKLGDTWAREQELQQALNADPRDEAALDGLRRLLASQQRWTDLAMVLEELISRADDERKAQRLLDVAWVYANKLDDLEAAYDRYQDVLDISVGNVEALGCLKEICQRREDWNGMVATLARESMAAESETRVVNYREIARLWDEKLGEPGTAVEAWHKVLELAPEDRTAYGALTELYRRLRDWPQFVEAAERWLILRRDEEPGLLNEIGITLARRLDEPERAVTFLLRAQARGQGDLEVMRAVAERFEQKLAWREAAELYSRVAEASPDKAVKLDLYQRIAAIAHKHIGDMPQAIRAYEQLLEIAPDHLPAMLALAELYDDTGRSQDALRSLDTLAGNAVAPAFLETLSDSERLAFHLRYGKLLEHADLKEQATAHYEASLQLMTGDRQGVLEVLSSLYQSLGRWDRYAATLQARIEGDSSLTKEALMGHYETLGKAWQAAGELELALEAFNKLKELAPSQVTVYLRMAEIHYQRRDWQTLLALYNNVIKYSTEVEQVIEAYLRKADILDEELSPTDPSYVAKAVLHYEKALQYDKRNAYAMLRLAEITLRGRQFQKAAEWLKRVLAVDPSNVQVARTHLLGGILCAEAQKDPTTAMANFRKASGASDRVEPYLDNLATAVEESPGNLEALLRIYREILPMRDSERAPVHP